jgi:hypothetical protein
MGPYLAESGEELHDALAATVGGQHRGGTISLHIDSTHFIPTVCCSTTPSSLTLFRAACWA